jgi:hypothetical protein
VLSIACYQALLYNKTSNLDRTFYLLLQRRAVLLRIQEKNKTSNYGTLHVFSILSTLLTHTTFQTQMGDEEMAKRRSVQKS